MGAWGSGLYAGDFALDLRAVIAAVSRLPLGEDALVQAVCDTEKAAVERIVYPPRPTIAQLMASAG